MLCGVTCLQMICEYLGKKYSMETFPIDESILKHILKGLYNKKR